MISLSRFLAWAARLVKHPTAPYHEQDVRAELEAILKEEGISFTRDAAGNVLADIGAGTPDLVLCAHMDHPGFQIGARLSPTQWEAEFRGGVGKAYFVPGIPLMLMPGRIPGKLVERAGDKCIIETGSTPVEEPKFATWALVDSEVREGFFHARVCDDLIGVAAIVATLSVLRESHPGVSVRGLLTRAEEVGFHGALIALENGSVPEGALVISLETSKELPGVAMGQGVIIRVGDKSSTFSSGATRYLVETASDLQKEDATFQFQRGLMTGGTCEATVFQEAGFRTTALCVALGNYHNCGEENRIKAEYVSLADAQSMVQLLAKAALRMCEYDAIAGRLNERLDKLRAEAAREFGIRGA